MFLVARGYRGAVGNVYLYDNDGCGCDYQSGEWNNFISPALAWQSNKVYNFVLSIQRYIFLLYNPDDILYSLRNTDWNYAYA